MKTCPKCGVRFTPKPGPGHPPKFCSAQCRGAAWRAANPVPPAAPRVPKPKTGTCGTCGKKIGDRHSYCSRACVAVSQRRAAKPGGWTKSLSGATPEEQRAHVRERKRWKPTVDAGRAYCQQGIPGNGSSGTCVEPTRWIAPKSRWVLGHRDDRTDWIGPVHHTCNQRDASSRGGQARKAIYGPYRGDGRSIHPDRPETRVAIPPRQCQICKQTFQPKTHRGVTCSDECRKARARLQTREWKAANPGPVREHRVRWRERRRLEL